MKVLLQIISLAGLLLTIIPPLLYFLGHMLLSTQQTLMFIGTILWFVSAPFWMNKQKADNI